MAGGEKWMGSAACGVGPLKERERKRAMKGRASEGRRPFEGLLKVRGPIRPS